MIDMEFMFDAAPWEDYADTLRPGDRASAATLLSLMEGEDQQTFEDLLFRLEEEGIGLDISDLPRGYGTGESALRLRREVELAAGGLNPSDLDDSDPLRLYLEEVAMTPAFGDEDILAEKAAAGDEQAAAQLTNLMLHRVVELAAEHAGYGVLLLDLIQEGSLGLWSAIQNRNGGDFREACEVRIREGMARAITLQARSAGVGQKLREALEDYRNVDEKLLSELGRNPSVQEIAEAMHTTPENAATVGKMLENARRLQQAKYTPEPQEDDPEEEQAVEDTAYYQARQRVHDMLSGLSETEASVITLRFGLEGGLPLSPENTGRKLGMTPGEVTALETAAMAKLRKQ